MQADAQERRFRRKDAAKYLREVWGVPSEPTTLAKQACLGGGPEFHKAGRIPIYPQSSLDSYAKSKLGPLRRSTSDHVVEGSR